METNFQNIADVFKDTYLGMGYESPISIIVHEIETKIENDAVMAVQKYGFDVNKEELLKALQYDRDQYNKGYAAARERFERPTGHWIVSGLDYKCSNCGMLPYFREYNFCPWCGARMEAEND